MAHLQESWLQDVAAANCIQAVRPSVSKTLLPVIEMQVRKVIQQAHKFHRRGKGQLLTVDDINQALELHGIEPIYGIVSASMLDGTGTTSLSSVSSAAASARAASANEISLVDLAKAPLPRAPYLPEPTLHWLAVNGVQPNIAENPSLVPAEEDKQPLLLPREMQQLFARATGVLLAAGPSDLTHRAVLSVLRSDSGLQELVPYFSRFIYQQVKSNTRSLPLLTSMMAATDSLLRNPHLTLEFHVQQLLPAIFTCVIAAKLSASLAEDHWTLRRRAAAIIARVCHKFRDAVLELQARICRTYSDALGEDKALATVYGGIVGLSTLGMGVVKELLLPQIQCIMSRLELAVAAALTAERNRVLRDKEKDKDRVGKGRDRRSDAGQQQGLVAWLCGDAARNRVEIDTCRAALVHAVGLYVAAMSRLPAMHSLVLHSAEGSSGSGSATTVHLPNSSLPVNMNMSTTSAAPIRTEQEDEAAPGSVTKKRRIAKAASSSAMKDKDKTLASSSTTTHVADPWASQKSRGGGSAPAVQVPVKLGLYGHGSYSFSATAVPVPSAGPVGVGGEQWPDLGEGLIVYHASTAPEAYHCRLLF